MENPNKKKYLILGIVGFLLSLSSLLTISILDKSLSNGYAISFNDPNGDSLVGTYYDGDIDAGVIILEGFGSDQTACRSVASEFSKLGFHIMTFDFSGHGRSSGSLGFDNAATDRLAKQVLSAKSEFLDLSELNNSEIIIVAHSMGARVAIQSSTIDPNPIKALILFGTSINLDINIQSAFFTGVLDSDLEWIQNLSENNPKTEIYLISGTLDDILTPTSAQLLYEKLGGESSVYPREIEIIPNVFHNYEIYSPRCIRSALNSAAKALSISIESDYIPINSIMRGLLWFLSLIGLFIFTTYLAKYLSSRESQKMETSDINPYELEIIDAKKYLKAKLFLWLLALPFTLVIFSICMIIPLGVPVFSLIYVGFIGGYGIIRYILYKKGKMPGTKGYLSPKTTKTSNNSDKEKGSIYFLILLMVLIILLSVYFARTGIYYVIPLNQRVIWLVILSILTIPGFYLDQIEEKIQHQILLSSRKNSIISVFIGLFPFILYSILFAFLRSFSGMLGGIQGLIILAFVISSGNLIQNVGKNNNITVIFKSFLIQLLILPQGVLFSIL